MNNLHEQLMEAKKRYLQQERLKRELNHLSNEQHELQRKEQQFLHTLQQEKEDVEKLERISLTNMFATLTGNNLERMEAEKREVVEARLKWREAYDSIQEMEQDLQVLKGRIDQLGDPSDEYERLLRQKKAYLIEKGQLEGQRLIEVAERRSEVQAELDEIDEAIVAGKQAVSALDQASSSLDSAENWGALDMLGGGLLTTAVKHSRVDDANTAVHSAQRHLRKFARELEDLGTHYNHNLEISGGLTLADFFLDGLIVDWFVQNRILTSHEEVRKMRNKTHAVTIDLDSLREKFVAEQKKLEEEQRLILESS
ncbi:hypothetical protein [Halobacillus sp. BBL2006]|uniref:hypothetical protein n=1 Tax=Halobacillus sp. BBL2006 TaxID=1543706 RepID=UPI000541D09B|nr:hypothetical protein [Halobacillus sp. BBL2006]KHE66748.1 hypothetical protein LD39_21170 [Halobacillus sp. BBL2006]